MFCGQCGSRIQSDESCCGSCGGDLANQQKHLQKITIRPEEIAGLQVIAADHEHGRSALSSAGLHRHSKLGVASFLISVCVGILSLLVGLFLLLNIAIVDDSTAPLGVKAVAVYVSIYCSLPLYLFITFDLLAFCIGLGGIIQKDRKKRLAYWGIAISILNIVSSIFVLVGAFDFFDNL